MRILVAGGSGQVARALASLRRPDFEFVTLGRPGLDLCDAATIEAAADRHRPAAFVNAAAYTAVDRAENEPDAAFAVNRDGAASFAAVAARRGLPVVHISTDYVFSGEKASPYTEADATEPLGVYGRSKLEGEGAVAVANPAHVILRTAWVYGPNGQNFLKTMLRLAADRDRIRVVADQFGTPTAATEIAAAIVAVLGRSLHAPDAADWRGVFHMVAAGETHWAGFAEEIFAHAAGFGFPVAAVDPIRTEDYPTPARRPRNSRLATDRFRQVFGYAPPRWQDGVPPCLAAMRDMAAAGGGEATRPPLP